jgi:diguanylate cyclase (GGDEF)-like protein
MASGRAADERGAGARRAFVVVLAGDRMGEMFPLNEGRTSIGRGLQADVRVNDEGISRTHALIELDADGLFHLSDAGSTNGTFANGQRIDRYTLREGDKIQIGATSVLRFTYHDATHDDMQRSLYETALRDRLTGVFNRGYFNNRLESDVSFALRHGKPLSLIVFEIDRLGEIIDRRGAEVGDGLLKELADRVKATTRSEDIFARFSAEEFALICRDVDALRASKAANRIMDLVRGKPLEAAGDRVLVTVSLGVSDLFMLREPSAPALVEAAVSALAIARRNGRDRVELYDPEVEPTRLT